MREPLESERTVREYLLGRVSDEATLEGIEERLFTDEDFCARVALAEDDIINDYVLGYLDERDAASFRATLAAYPERRAKLDLTERLRAKALAANPQAVSPKAAGARPQKAEAAAMDVGGAKVGGAQADNAKAEDAQAVGVRAGRREATPSLVASLAGFFRRPLYAGTFALLLVAAVASALYLFKRSGPDELAELRAVYRRERPTAARISGFDYAPFTQLRGEPEARERNLLRRLENSFIEETERTPDAQSLHALGSFYLTQRKYPEAVREFEGALRLAGGSARIHNDLGAAHFELARSLPKEKGLEHLGRALEEFTKATELDGASAEALFNRALALQELGLPRQARAAWALYLQKDPSSPWAEEARRNLARLGDEQTRFKSDGQVLEDFLAAYRGRDDARARRIHDETKGSLKGVAVPLQLSRRYLLARRDGDEAAARESLDALAYVGEFERARHSEFFFLSWPPSTRAWAPTERTSFCAPRRFSTAASATSPAATTSKPSPSSRRAATSSSG